ncbi:hypothetical protein D3C73_603400 [compost metagenome]
MRQVVGGFQRAIGAGHGLIEVAGIAHHLAGLERGGFEFLAIGNRVVAGVGAVVPFDFQCLAALDRRPGIARHHGDAAQGLELRRQRTAFDLYHFDHAWDFHRRAAIEAFDLAAIHRGPRNGRVQHAVEMHVGAVHRTTIDDVLTVDGLGAFLTDISKFRRLLESQAFSRRHGQSASGGGQRAIAQFAARRFMNDFMKLRLALAD